MNFLYSLSSFLQQPYDSYYLGPLIISFFVSILFVVVTISDRNERREPEEKKK